MRRKQDIRKRRRSGVLGDDRFGFRGGQRSSRSDGADERDDLERGGGYRWGDGLTGLGGRGDDRGDRLAQRHRQLDGHERRRDGWLGHCQWQWRVERHNVAVDWELGSATRQ